jgi:DNA (cytosine-5)-methyltransferase 1
MYQTVDPTKSYLVLTLLSYVEAIRPKYCVFENVRGFFQWRLMALREGPHIVSGGLKMGGLKLVLRVLTDLGYQIRFGILQAGTYIYIILHSCLPS